MWDEKNNRVRLLIIDDEPSVGNILFEVFCDRYDCIVARSGTEAMEKLGQMSFDIVLSDIDLGDMNGIDLVPLILDTSPDASVLMISGNQTIDHAIEAMRSGAFDYIKKPFDIDMVEIAVQKAHDHHQLRIAKRRHETELERLVQERTDQLQFLSYHDAVTGLPNRMLLNDRLAQALISERRGGGVGLIYGALDKLKKVQDTLGHTVTNTILKTTAERLETVFGDHATISRIDSDEFALLLPKLRSEQDVIKAVSSISENIRDPFIIGEHELYLTASIGVSMFPSDGRDPETLSKKSGAALLRARENGGDNWQYYTPGMNSSAMKRFAIEGGIRRALERDEFTVLYQPKVNAANGKITGVEALVRWEHPELGFLQPDEFIPAAEDSGSVVPLGAWVLRKACSDVRDLNDLGIPIGVAVNFSLKQLQSAGVVDEIMEILSDTGLDATLLNLEITESSIMNDLESAIETLGALKALGVSISLDDFGTGYSSFGHLKRLPIDVLKIDKSFVQDVTSDADGAALVMAMISLAQNLRLKVVAEGVETKEQLSFLNLLRCDEYQGYFFSQPVDVDSLKNLIALNSKNGTSLGK